MRSIPQRLPPTAPPSSARPRARARAAGRRARLLLLLHDVVQAVVEELQVLLHQRRDAQVQALVVARVGGRLRLQRHHQRRAQRAARRAAPLAPPALLGALAAPTRPTFASASVQALFCAGFLRRRCATCRRAASSAPRGRQRGGHLLQTEMGISSNTSRQDTAAAFSFSLVTAPVLYTCGRRGERAVRLAPGARSRCRLSQRAVSLQALLAATPAPRSRPAGASPLLHLLQQCRQTAGQAEGAPV